jgi:hypothetical protein
MTRAYCYKICRGYSKTSKRYKRRNRRPRFTCKGEQLFEEFMDRYYYESCNYTLDKVIKELTPCLLWLKRQYELVYTKIHGKELGCYQSGFDSYGYANEKKILDDLDYISDRWRCDWRIRWIINLLDKEYNYNG